MSISQISLVDLYPQFKSLQQKYGESTLDPIYGAGCISKPDICFVFMNPTARNISASKQWTGLKAPWLGTKSVWKLFWQLKLLESSLYNQILSRKPGDWTEKLALKLYHQFQDNNIYITNLAKCTQLDARPLPNNVFKDYLPLFRKEIEFIKPKTIVTFGNQVSSIALGQSISVSRVRQRQFSLKGQSNQYPAYAIYYPVGQGMRNMDKAVEDIKQVINRD